MGEAQLVQVVDCAHYLLEILAGLLLGQLFGAFYIVRELSSGNMFHYEEKIFFGLDDLSELE